MASYRPKKLQCVDLIGKYNFKAKGGRNEYKMKTQNGDMVFLQAVTMIDPATGWIEIKAVPSARAD